MDLKAKSRLRDGRVNAPAHAVPRYPRAELNGSELLKLTPSFSSECALAWFARRGRGIPGLPWQVLSIHKQGVSILSPSSGVAKQEDT